MDGLARGVTARPSSDLGMEFERRSFVDLRASGARESGYTFRCRSPCTWIRRVVWGCRRRSPASSGRSSTAASSSPDGRCRARANSDASSAIQVDFRFGRADARSFPAKTWRRLLLECLGSAAERICQYNDPAGLSELREAVADFIGPGRGITTSPERMLIVSGFQQGINLAAHLLLGVGTPVVIEAPCYRGAAFLFESYGAKMIPVPFQRIEEVSS